MPGVEGGSGAEGVAHEDEEAGGVELVDDDSGAGVEDAEAEGTDVEVNCEGDEGEEKGEEEDEGGFDEGGTKAALGGGVVCVGEVGGAVEGEGWVSWVVLRRSREWME